MGRLIVTELTAHEIVDAFPDEAKEYVPTVLKVLKVQMLDVNDKMERLSLLPLSPDRLALCKQIIESTKPSLVHNRIKIYTQVLELLKNKEHKQYYDNINKVAQAKATPIESLVALNKQKVSSSRIHGCCPLGHNDNNPSFVIYRTTNTFHCFSCKASGDSIKFYQLHNMVGFQEAIERLSKWK